MILALSYIDKHCKNLNIQSYSKVNNSESFYFIRTNESFIDKNWNVILSEKRLNYVAWNISTSCYAFSLNRTLQIANINTKTLV